MLHKKSLVGPECKSCFLATLLHTICILPRFVVEGRAGRARHAPAHAVCWPQEAVSVAINQIVDCVFVQFIHICDTDRNIGMLSHQPGSVILVSLSKELRLEPDVHTLGLQELRHGPLEVYFNAAASKETSVGFGLTCHMCCQLLKGMVIIYVVPGQDHGLMNPSEVVLNHTPSHAGQIVDSIDLRLWRQRRCFGQAIRCAKGSLRNGVVLIYNDATCYCILYVMTY